MTDADRIAELEEKVAYLEGELGLSMEAERYGVLRHTYGIRPQSAMILLALYDANRPLSRGHLLDLLPTQREDGDDHAISVHVAYLRRILGRGAIRNIWGFGYVITPEGLSKVRSVLEPEGVG